MSERTPVPRPRWGRLYGLIFTTIAAVAAVQFLPVPDTARTALGSGLGFAGFVAAVFWLRWERAALDQQDWCACASQTLTVRVIVSERGRCPRAPGARPQTLS